MSLFIGFTGDMLRTVAEFLMCEPCIYFVGMFLLLLACTAFGKLIHR